MITIITLNDIFKSVCEHISNVTDITVYDSDLNEPVKRPSFKIFMDTVRAGLFSSALRELKVYFNIYFYSSDRKHSKAEIMDIEDKIAFSFLEPFEIKENCCVYVDDLEFEKVADGILNVSFNFEIAAEFAVDDKYGIGNETMEELRIKEEVK